MGISAILAQEDENGKLHPIAFGSQTLRGAEVHYGLTDLEMLAVVYALKNYKVYVYGAKLITISMDHQALTSMIHKNEELASDRQQ